MFSPVPFLVAKFAVLPLLWLFFGLPAAAQTQLPPVEFPYQIAASWETIAQRKVLRVGIKDNLRPLGFRDETGELQGLEIVLAKEIARRLLGDETAIVFVPLKNQDRIEALLNNDVDIVIAQMSVNGARSRILDFTRPYFYDQTAIISNQAQLTTWEAFNGKIVGILPGSSTVGIIKQVLPQAELVGVSSFREANQLLKAGKIDGFASDHSVLAGWAQQTPEYQVMPLPQTEIPVAIALPRGLQYVELKIRLELILRELAQSGWLREQQEYWGLNLSSQAK